MTPHSRIGVIHSSPEWLPTTQTWMYNQARYLPSHVDLHVVCQKTQNLDQFNLPNIHSLAEAPPWRYGWDKFFLKFKFRHYLGLLVEIAKREQITILHSHFGPVGWADIAAAKRANLKHVVTFYGQDVNYLPNQDPRWYKRYRRLFEQVHQVLCEGPHMATCIQQLGCPSEKICVHHLGVSVEAIAFQPRTWQPGEPLRVLIAASFREKKGIPYALEALGRLQNEIPLEITIIGDANQEVRCQAEKQVILATLAKYSLQPITRMLGYQSHTVFFQECYKHHLFLSPSVTASDGDTEGGAPVSLIEVAATGMPIISTIHCDIPAVVQHPATGLLAKERDVEALLEYLRWLIRYPEQWLPMVKAGRQRIEQEFCAQTQGRKLANIYTDLNRTADL